MNLWSGRNCFRTFCGKGDEHLTIWSYLVGIPRSWSECKQQTAWHWEGRRPIGTLWLVRRSGGWTWCMSGWAGRWQGSAPSRKRRWWAQTCRRTWKIRWMSHVKFTMIYVTTRGDLQRDKAKREIIVGEERKCSEGGKKKERNTEIRRGKSDRARAKHREKRTKLIKKGKTVKETIFPIFCSLPFLPHGHF